MKIAIVGYGRMGKAISKLAQQHGHDIICHVNSDDKLETIDLSDADVAIEFSTPQSAFDNITTCLNQGVPVVSGTTGWLDQLDEIHKLCGEVNGTFFYASNFSIGMNIVFEVNKNLTRLMNQFPEFGPSVKEVHHIHKLDAPSGTAKTLADDMIQILGQFQSWSLDEDRGVDSMRIESIREGEVNGIHSVQFESPDEKVTLNHEAFNRDIFAKGTLMAARWIQGKKGTYSFSDLLNFTNPK